MREKTALAAITLVSCFFPCPAFLAHSLTPRLLTELRDRQQITERRKPSLLRCAPRGARRSFELRMTDQVPDPKDIFEALMAGDKAGVEAYVNAGGDCGVRDAIGDTPLMIAVENEMSSAVTKLAKDGGADVDRPSATTGETPLQLAAYYGYTNLARILVNECDAELDIRNNRGDTALSLACFWGNTDTVKFLLDAGADPNIKNAAGERPGDSFDSVFVPESGDLESAGDDGQDTGPREAIMQMLDASRSLLDADRRAQVG